MDTNICRVCLISKDDNDIDFKDIFLPVKVNNNREIKLIDAIMDCAPIRIDEDDDLPKQICVDCVEKLNVSYNFRQTCMDSDYKLKLQSLLSHPPDNQAECLIEKSESNTFELLESKVETFEDDDNVSNSSFNMNEFILQKDDLSKSPSEAKEESVNIKFECNLCEEKLNTEKSYKNHLEVHLGERPHVCEFCKKGFKQRSHLIVHLKIHTGDTRHVCEICSKKFITKGLLRHHNQRHHPNKVNAKKENESKEEDNEDAEESTETKIKEEFIETPKTEFSSDDRPYICEFCSKGFKQSSHLLVHRKIHTGDTKHICEICCKKFTTKGLLRWHNNKHHSHLGHDSTSKISGKLNGVVDTPKIKAERIKGPFTCKHCNKVLTSNFVYQNHLRVHSGMRPFTCEICGKGFKQTSHLSVHKRSHTGDKRFSCEVCGKRFITNSMRKKHMLRHAPDKIRIIRTPTTNIKQKKIDPNADPLYMCEVCGKIFKQRGHLTCHKAIHTEDKPHQCNICFKSYKWRHTVWRHMKRHTGDKRFKCSMCDKSFIENSALKKHTRVHTGERPNQCPICYKSFKETWHLKTHLKMHN